MSSRKSENLQTDGLLLSKVCNDLDEKLRKNYVLWHCLMKMTFSSKNKMRNLLNFDADNGKSENLHFDVLLLSIAYKVSAKKLQNNYVFTLKSDPNFEETLTFCLKNNMRNLVNFSASSGNSEN